MIDGKTGEVTEDDDIGKQETTLGKGAAFYKWPGQLLIIVSVEKILHFFNLWKQAEVNV